MTEKAPGPTRLGNILSRELRASAAGDKEPPPRRRQPDTRLALSGPSTKPQPGHAIYRNKFEKLDTSVKIARFLWRVKDPQARLRWAESHPDQDLALQAYSAVERSITDSTNPILAKPPKDDYQLDLLIPAPGDVAVKDRVSLMEIAPFRLSSRTNVNHLEYKLRNTVIKIDASQKNGMATAHDYDFIHFVVSHLTETVNRHQLPGRMISFHAYDFLRFARRHNGGRQHTEIAKMLNRLATTHIEITTTDDDTTTTEGFSFIGEWSVSSHTPSGKVNKITVEIPKWIYNGVVFQKVPAVLTLNPDYLLIHGGIHRFLYRFARKAAGVKNNSVTYTLEELQRRSGSPAPLRKFRAYLNNLPDNRILDYTFRLKTTRRAEHVVITHSPLKIREST